MPAPLLSTDSLAFTKNALSHHPGSTTGKESTCQCRRGTRLRFDPWVRKIPWKRAWQPTPVFLCGESHGQRKEPDELQFTGLQRRDLACTHAYITQWLASMLLLILFSIFMLHFPIKSWDLFVLRVWGDNKVRLRDSEYYGEELCKHRIQMICALMRLPPMHPWAVYLTSLGPHPHVWKMRILIVTLKVV